MGGGSTKYVRPRGGWGGKYKPDVQKRFFWAFWISHQSPTTPPPVHGRSDHKIFGVLDVFYARHCPDISGRRKRVVFQTIEVGRGGGGSKKSFFVKTSLMDDP